jgi:acyl-homoserine-lactone acylase
MSAASTPGWRWAAPATSARSATIIGRTLGIGFTNTIAADRAGDALYADVTTVPNVDAPKLEACATEVTPLAATQRIYVLDGSRAACNWDVDPATPEPGLMPDRLQPTLFRRDWVQNSNDSYWLSNPAAPLPAASPVIGPVDTRPSFRTQSGIRRSSAPWPPAR